MRKLTKTAKPKVLTDNADSWHAELKAILDRGDKPSDAVKGRYGHPTIKSALIQETHGKCAYCESILRHIAHGDIEHIIPKSKVPSKAYDWTNLTLACDVCNENKGDYLGDDPAKSDENLIDPYVDEPGEHFLFLRELVTPRPDSLRATVTESKIKLSRIELLERRRERMAFLDGLVRAYCLADASFKPILLQDLVNNHLSETNEYAASSRAYFEYLCECGVLGE